MFVTVTLRDNFIQDDLKDEQAPQDIHKDVCMFPEM